MMNELKKKMIYYYLIFTFALVIAEWYLIQLLVIHLPEWMNLTETTGMLLETAALLISILLFALFAYGYYKKVKQSILQEVKRQAKERNMIFANIAHDLKNPISSVLGFARAMENGAVKEEEQQLILHTICEKTLQVDKMIQKLFQYAKLESEGYSLQCRSTDLCGLLREVLALQYSEIEGKNMELYIDIPDECVNREIDGAEFSRMLRNLISNAIKHNGDGTRLLVSLQQEKSNVKIVIADSGVEIPQQQRQTIFEPFQCSDESRVSKDGSGLGLAIARQIVHLHKGKIYIDDGIEGYTKGFVIELE